MKTAFKTAGAPAAPSEYKSPKMRIIQTTPRSVLCGSSNDGGINDMEEEYLNFCEQCFD